ncbi:MAG: hypothetical protein RRY95_07770, partial [Oscillospiraceae bacterium]
RCLIALTKLIIKVFAGACLGMGRMAEGDGFFRQARHFFAGILGGFQGKMTRHDGKRAVFRRFDHF